MQKEFNKIIIASEEQFRDAAAKVAAKLVVETVNNADDIQGSKTEAALALTHLLAAYGAELRQYLLYGAEE